MSQYYGVVQGTRGEATRQGHKSSGLQTTAASWNGAVRVQLYYDDKTNKDMFRVYLTPWRGVGRSTLIAQGALGEDEDICFGEDCR